MKRNSLIYVCILAAALLSLPAQEKHPSIAFESLSRDAGKVTEGETVKHVFKFANKGNAVLEIIKVEPS